MTRTNMAMKLIYFHGFGSSAASGTIRTLREKLPDFEVIAPDIPVDPAEALPFLRELCEKEQPNVVVGTSMGGMYAQQMFGFNRICVNPAFFMSKTSKVLKNFAEMEARQFDGVTPSDSERVWGMFGINDTQVNCEEAFLQHYHNIIHFSGGHRLDDVTINEVLIPLIHLLA